MFSVVTFFFWGLENVIAANGLNSFLALGNIPKVTTTQEASLVQTGGTAAISVFVVAVVAALGHFGHSVAADRIRSETEGRSESSTLVPFLDFAVLTALTIPVIALLLILDDVVPAH